MNDSVANYYALTSNTAMENYILTDTNEEPYHIIVRYFYLSSQFNESRENSYEYLNETFLGPFNSDNDTLLREILSDVESMTIDYSLRNIIP